MTSKLSHNTHKMKLNVCWLPYKIKKKSNGPASTQKWRLSTPGLVVSCLKSLMETKHYVDDFAPITRLPE